jgi:hypothetical protein
MLPVFVREPSTRKPSGSGHTVAENQDQPIPFKFCSTGFGASQGPCVTSYGGLVGMSRYSLAWAKVLRET